jgi:hypothetical protein
LAIGSSGGVANLLRNSNPDLAVFEGSGSGSALSEADFATGWKPNWKVTFGLSAVSGSNPM